MYRIVLGDTGEVIGTSDEHRAFGTLHPGAVYLHQGEQYLVQELDLVARVALVEEADPDFYTQARDITDIVIVNQIDHRPLGRRRALLRRRRGHERRSSGSSGSLSRPTRSSASSRSRLPPVTLRDARRVVDAARAADRRARAWVPASCPAASTARSTARSACCRSSRPATDGTSAASRRRCTQTPASPRSSSTTGIRAARASASAATAPRNAGSSATLERLRDCPCRDGCPSCVVSPKCGNGNEPLDKAAGRALLAQMLGE